MPRPFHASARVQAEQERKRLADREAYLKRQAEREVQRKRKLEWLKQERKQHAMMQHDRRRGRATRGRTACKCLPSCLHHTLKPGNHWCASTVDSDPFLRCSGQCACDKLYCSDHAACPDLGRKLALYAFECRQRGVPVEMAAFVASAGYQETPMIADIRAFSATLLEKI